MKCLVVCALTVFCATARAQVGRVDTIGGTTYDWQFGGPAYRWVVNAPGHGIPVMWMRSQSEQTTFPDINTGYNYYDYTTRCWLGNDTTSFRLRLLRSESHRGCPKSPTITSTNDTRITSSAHPSLSRGWYLRARCSCRHRPQYHKVCRCSFRSLFTTGGLDFPGCGFACTNPATYTRWA